MVKTLLFSILVLFSCIQGYSQTESTVDSLQRELQFLRQEMDEVKMNLNQSHRRFRTGTILYVSGLGLTVLGAIATNRNQSGIGNAFLIGSGLCAVGLVLHVDSHKFIGRAGMVRRRGSNRRL